ncbi:uncharacterized protein I303_100975 [Kwoniella dejecticola CBS 10117]|uniref:HIT-type domain-containing protein n=1 Tax=Kwoniella dejecticola CBS 10117 TaxID=1296121 RepID=A0A1A6AGH3_9TREE|nr:uncharacterized protein I303_00979 [Kwoniella dejecticola CBS 10117]OBR89157.1 hypothetical protein I303_00979 [Kwoniella dejecticola CBS 10117]
MNHPLPARPSFIPSSSISIAGPSRLPLVSNPNITPKPPADITKCTICSIPPKYTCPRCSKRTCSLDCSKKHKTQDECSGVRDPTAFVPLNQYSQGAWSDDYKWLEEGRRKVSAWGEDVKIDEMSQAEHQSRIQSQAGVIDRKGKSPAGRTKVRPATKKAWKLKLELAKLGCEIDYLPSGMERKKLNQSNWSPKSQQIHVTIYLTVPAALLKKASDKEEPKTIIHPRVLFSPSSSGEDKSKSIQTLSSLTNIPLVSHRIVYLLPFHSTPSRAAPAHTEGQRLFYPPLGPSKPLAEVFKGTSWIEFPTVELMDAKKWESGLKEQKFAIIPLSEPVLASRNPVRTRDSGWGKRKVVNVNDGETTDRRVKDEGSVAKKPKLDTAGLMALGDYESDEDEDGDGAVDDGDEDENEGGGADVAESDEEIEEAIAPDADVDEEDQDEEEDGPSIVVLQAVGLALAADLGEA